MKKIESNRIESKGKSYRMEGKGKKLTDTANARKKGEIRQPSGKYGSLNDLYPNMGYLGYKVLIVPQ